MFTVCPKCKLPLAVTAGDLRAGQGYVRCGRCANVFNALLALSEEPSTPAQIENLRPPEPAPPAALIDTLPPPSSPPEVSPSEPLEPPPAVAPAPESDSHPDSAAWAPPEPDDRQVNDLQIPDDPTLPDVLEAAGIVVEESGPDAAQAEPTALAQSQTGSDAEDVLDIQAMDETSEVHEFRGTGTYETIVLEGDGITQTEEFISEEDVAEFERTQENEVKELRRRLLGEAPEEEPPAIPAAGREAALPLGEQILRHRQPEAGPAPLWPWALAAVALAVLLAVQVVNHWRNDLAARPLWNAPLTALYRILGVELSPEWDLQRYDVRQLGASTDAARNAITVRVSVANRSDRDQPVPWLRLTLLDRFGKRVAARDLPPDDYLPAEDRGQRFMAADQRIDSEVAVVDPGPDAASFEVDVCLPGAGGRMRCANDVSALSAAR